MDSHPVCNNIIPFLTLILPINAWIFLALFADKVDDEGMLAATALILVQCVLVVGLLPLSVMMAYECNDKPGHRAWFIVAGIATLLWLIKYIYFFVWGRKKPKQPTQQPAPQPGIEDTSTKTTTTKDL